MEFVNDFESTDELLTDEVEEKGWFERDDLGAPNWVILVLAVVALLFAFLLFYICFQSRRNKSEQKLAERAIAREL